MKITRLARGFRIACLDSEFELLRLVAQRGLASLIHSNDRSELSFPVECVLRSDRFCDLSNPLRIDVDRREPSVREAMETSHREVRVNSVFQVVRRPAELVTGKADGET